MLTLLHTSTSVQAVVAAAAVAMVPLSAVAVVASLNVVLPVTVLVAVLVTLLLFSHCFSIVHIVWKQLELEIPDRYLESEDDALDPFVEDDFDP